VDLCHYRIHISTHISAGSTSRCNGFILAITVLSRPLGWNSRNPLVEAIHKRGYASKLDSSVCDSLPCLCPPSYVMNL
jgi:hypothetical protein